MIQKELEEQTNLANTSKIKLRSEKARNMIGEMPSFLIRWGNTLLFVIFLLLVLTTWFIYSYKI